MGPGKGLKEGYFFGTRRDGVVIRGADSEVLVMGGVRVVWIITQGTDTKHVDPEIE